MTHYDFGFTGLRKDGTLTTDPDVVFGVDLAPGNAETTDWPYLTKSKDTVMLFEVLEHFRLDPLFVFLEANRVLTKGGLLVLPRTSSCVSKLWMLSALLRGLLNPCISGRSQSKTPIRHKGGDVRRDGLGGGVRQNGKWALSIIWPGGLKSEPGTSRSVLTEDKMAIGSIHRKDAADLA